MFGRSGLVNDRFQHAARCLAVLVIVFAAAVHPAQAITINLNFNNTNLPAFDSDGSQLQDIVSAAASIWEDIIEDNHVIDIEFGWQDLNAANLGIALVTAGDVVGGRPVSAQLAFDTRTNPSMGAPMDRLWYFDPTPLNHSEFDMQQTLFRDLNDNAKTLFFNGNTRDLMEVGYEGDARNTAPLAAQNGSDLLTVALHEIGHALGMLSNVASGETSDNPSDFDISPLFTGLAVTAANVADPTDREHLRCAGCLMFPSAASGERALPSATDVFAIATSPFPGWSDIDLARQDFWGGIFWETDLNWEGNQEPGAFDDAFIRHGGNVQLNGSALVENLFVGEGSNLLTMDERIDVDTQTTVRHDGVENAQILVHSSGELETGDLVLEGGELDMDGGLADIQDDLFIQSANGVRGRITGHGTVDVADVLSNNGLIRPDGGTILLTTANVDPVWNLDGASDGEIDATAGNLLVNGQLTDDFDGLISVGAGQFAAFSDGWTLGDGGELQLNGGADAANAATIAGTESSLRGLVEVSGFSQILTTDTGIVGQSVVNLAQNSTLVITGQTVLGPMATVNLADGAELKLDGQTSIQAPTIDGTGIVTFNNNTTVSSPTTINAQYVNLDGDFVGTETLTISSALTINADDIEVPGQTPGFNRDTIEINGLLGRLQVNLSDPAATWTLADTATIDIGGNNIFVGTHLVGSDIRVDGTILVDGLSLWAANVDVAGTLMTNDAASMVQLSSTTRNIIRSSATVGGDGALRIRSGAALRVEHLADIDMALQNQGTLRPGLSAGAVSVESYEQTETGLLAIELGGLVAGTQYDQLLVGSTAELAGGLIVSLLDDFLPTLGDSFDIIAGRSVIGTFDTALFPFIGGGRVFDIDYQPDLVRLEIVMGLLGDTDSDGDVDIADLNNVRNGFGMMGMPVLGDTDGDGDVDIADLNNVRNNFGAVSPAPQPVPEPASLVLGVFGLAFLGLSAARPSRQRRESA